MKRILTILCTLTIILLWTEKAPAVHAAAKYDGKWRYYQDVGQYGLDEITLLMENRGKQVYLECQWEYFLPLYDLRENFQNRNGKVRSSIVYGNVQFNSKGQAVLKFKDPYNNGQLTVQMQKNGVNITWKGQGSSEYSFPNGTYNLNKKINTSAAESKSIGILLSNLTELHWKQFNVSKASSLDLIDFGVLHNFINNFETTITGTSDGRLFIPKAAVEQSLLKYFNINFRSHQSVTGYEYNGKGYLFDGYNVYPIDYVKVKGIYDLGSGKVEVNGELYDPNDPSSGTYGRVEAVIQKAGSRYVIKTLMVKN
ncbi:hypothetical protein GRF59_20905 [Paenibacillus sp. HJL G12]|uniref:Uncharacterized protein n=1 Tax=Paenibacillus dendrobii TaxID=2691084 RepID=A0A7X3LK48_9BACL|nr:hypothetical protein [Paenibacillus dendrobii]MWV46084.1 hypothetical protein [Paenibacillus dendrobii]